MGQRLFVFLSVNSGGSFEKLRKWRHGLGDVAGLRCYNVVNQEASEGRNPTRLKQGPGSLGERSKLVI